MAEKSFSFIFFIMLITEKEQNGFTDVDFPDVCLPLYAELGSFYEWKLGMEG